MITPLLYPSHCILYEINPSVSSSSDVYVLPFVVVYILTLPLLSPEKLELQEASNAYFSLSVKSYQVL